MRTRFGSFARPLRSSRRGEKPLRSQRGVARTLAVAPAFLAALALAAAALPGCVRETTPAATTRTAPEANWVGPEGSKGCVSCHVGQQEPHPLPEAPSEPGRFAGLLGCVDCHGGDATVVLPRALDPRSEAASGLVRKAHVLPADPAAFGAGPGGVPSAANAEHAGTQWLRASAEYVRFVNPGDLRIADRTCGTAGCHGAVDAYGEPRSVDEDHVLRVKKSMMTHGSMLWQAALYNNGASPSKLARYGESYSEDGEPQRLVTVPAPTPEETIYHGVLPSLDPLPRFEVGQPSNLLRIFEEGQRRPILPGLPAPGFGNSGSGIDEEHGRPANRLSARGLGTGTRTDPVWLNLQRTRLLDPTLNLPGTNDQAGDYRQSGCTACHMIYANDRDPLAARRQGADSLARNGAQWSSYGNAGQTAETDPALAEGESGHPIRHLLTRQIPTSQCIVCHMHPGTAVSNTYTGYTWWDLETDGAQFWPEEERKPSQPEIKAITARNPEGSTPKGKWSDPAFLAQTGSDAFNAKLDSMQTADFHGHGFVYRAVWKRDREGNLLDAQGERVAPDDPDRWTEAVHLKDIHLERGMHCVDCHFTYDAHGDGALYGELRAATAIKCVDCHGTISDEATLTTTGNTPRRAEGEPGQDLARSMTPFGPRFRWEGEGPARRLVQRSQVDPKATWEVPQVSHSVTEGHPSYSEKAAYAKTVRFEPVDGGADTLTFGGSPDASAVGHRYETMSCYSCHTSWIASCFGCHLPMKANEKRDALHYEGDTQRNWTSYSFQTLRSDVFMLGRDGSVTGGKTMPVRSACAVMVGSQNQNREWVYSQQQTVSAEGYSGTSFSPHFPHTVRGTETRGCTDCHLGATEDNNAVIAQVLMQGVNAVNFIGRYAYVAEGEGGLSGVVVTERDEPQAVLGSRLHELAWPERFRAHQDAERVLDVAVHHSASSVFGLPLPLDGSEVLDVQLRGEYLYTANGSGGLRVYDVAQIDQKGFSKKIVSAPVSPLGQRLAVDTTYATSVATPSTQAVDPARLRDPMNQEQPIHLLYAFLYVTDREEGLILVNAATLLDGDPTNNHLERALTFNPDGALTGARQAVVAGERVYVLTPSGVAVVSVTDPFAPKLLAELALEDPRALAVQWRYGFVTCADGLRVIDLTDPAHPALVPDARVPLADAHGVYVSRTYAYVAAGKEGLAVVDVTRPRAPQLVEAFTADGALNDARDVKVGMTNASQFAYVADGANGLRVLQLSSPDTTPGLQGFSPKPAPRLIATYPTQGPAVRVSEGIDRDRAVDESGHQTGVFGRVGARPFTKEEQERLYLHEGELYRVSDDPPARDAPPASGPTEGGAR